MHYQNIKVRYRNNELSYKNKICYLFITSFNLKVVNIHYFKINI